MLLLPVAQPATATLTMRSLAITDHSSSANGQQRAGAKPIQPLNSLVSSHDTFADQHAALDAAHGAAVAAAAAGEGAVPSFLALATSPRRTSSQPDLELDSATAQRQWQEWMRHASGLPPGAVEENKV